MFIPFSRAVVLGVLYLGILTSAVPVVQDGTELSIASATGLVKADHDGQAVELDARARATRPKPKPKPKAVKTPVRKPTPIRKSTPTKTPIRKTAPTKTAKPVVTRTSAKPVVTRTSAKPAVTRTSAKPVVTRTSAKPAVTRTSAKPAVTRTSAKPAVTRTSAKPAVTRTSAKPAVTRTSAKPAVTRTSAKPAVTRTSAKPAVTRTSAKPAVTRTSAKPAVTRTSAKPVVTRTSAKPAVTRTSAKPVVTRTSAKPVPTKAPAKPVPTTKRPTPAKPSKPATPPVKTTSKPTPKPTKPPVNGTPKPSKTTKTTSKTATPTPSKPPQCPPPKKGTKGTKSPRALFEWAVSLFKRDNAEFIGWHGTNSKTAELWKEKGYLANPKTAGWPWGSAGTSGADHELGPGVYVTDEMGTARGFANINSDANPGTTPMLCAIFARSSNQWKNSINKVWLPNNIIRDARDPVLSATYEKQRNEWIGRVIPHSTGKDVARFAPLDKNRGGPPNQVAIPSALTGNFYAVCVPAGSGQIPLGANTHINYGVERHPWNVRDKPCA